MIDAIAWIVVVLVCGFFATIAVVGLTMLAFILFGVPLAAFVRFIRG